MASSVKNSTSSEWRFGRVREQLPSSVDDVTLTVVSVTFTVSPSDKKRVKEKEDTKHAPPSLLPRQHVFGIER